MPAPLTTLAAIRTKVRRLTRSPSTAQLTDAQIDEYINTSVLYDFPEHLRLFTLRKKFTFFTQPNISVYETISSTTFVSSTDPFVNFKNKYITLEKPGYVAGYEVLWSQDRDQFFELYPRLNNIELVGTGNNSNAIFTGTLNNRPVLQEQVLFSSITSTGVGISLVDVPVVDATTGVKTRNGNLFVPGLEPTTPPTTVTATNTINYVTGVFAIDFGASVPGSSTRVEAQTVPYVAARPQSLLFFNNKITLRPVPDKPYRVEVEVYEQPTSLLAGANRLELDQWWQYISYLAAKKVFEDRMDLESVQMIVPELKNQERLVLRRTIVEQTKERTATIYTDQLERGGYNWWGQNF